MTDRHQIKIFPAKPVFVLSLKKHYFWGEILPEFACPGWQGEVLRVQESHTAELSPLLSTSPKCGFDEENDGV